MRQVIFCPAVNFGEGGDVAEESEQSVVWPEYRLFFTNKAIQQSRVVRAVFGANADIFFTTNTMLGALYILTTKFIEIIHIIHERFFTLQVLCQHNVGTEKRIMAYPESFVNTDRSQGKKYSITKKHIRRAGVTVFGILRGQVRRSMAFDRGQDRLDNDLLPH